MEKSTKPTKNIIDRFQRDERGSMYIDVVVKFVIMACIVLTVVSFYGIFVKHQNVTYVTSRIVRDIEVSGVYDYNTVASFNALKQTMGIPEATMRIENVSYFPGGGGRIQLRDRFTIVVTYPYRLTVLQPAGTARVEIPITLQSTLTGMSEVFWR